MGCDPPGPPFDTWKQELDYILCEAYKAAGGDCCDLVPPDNDGDIGTMTTVDDGYDAHLASGGFSTPAEKAEFLGLMDDLEDVLDKPGNSLSAAANTKGRDLIAKARTDLGPNP